MTDPAINVLRPAFADPRGLRDMIIVGVDAADWGRLLAWVAEGGWVATYRVDDDDAPLPATFAEAFLARSGGDHTAVLSIDVAGATVNCHFWSDWEIELDIASRDFQNGPTP